jgi:hypothetical protein
MDLSVGENRVDQTGTTEGVIDGDNTMIDSGSAEGLEEEPDDKLEM